MKIVETIPATSRHHVLEFSEEEVAMLRYFANSQLLLFIQGHSGPADGTKPQVEAAAQSFRRLTEGLGTSWNPSKCFNG